MLAHLDGTMINQAFTNLLKNAAEAIDERLAKDPSSAAGRDPRGAGGRRRRSSSIDIQDNGNGLPDQPARLFEPYVTHRAKGTGLGLPIVKKIIEEHDGTLELMPAPVFEGSDAARRLGAHRAAAGAAGAAAGKATRRARSPRS